ncbi:MAG: membrane-bound O-acyltransferase family protein [SAR86 cluster bacterium]|uniref:Probable alginate O-acetylase n=1 Tax=SAR86 cluster bacterium TaxID=2030880 RepID=A0A2A4WYX5_9GAMM|nr:MAG: membrane-bound O-acyltransferase family protein [SAR86 cluster bacterium]
MLFNTPLFFLFFSCFFFLYSFVFLKRYPRVLLILVGSLIFYSGWNFRFIPLLIVSGVIDYFVANAIQDATDARRRKLLLTVSIVTNLGILAIFKYSDFAMQSVTDMFGLLGYNLNSTMLNFVLPVGISFYTFQSMSYTIDVYRGDMKARKGLLTFIAALSFFPQLVAGPILRARHILPQLEHLPSPTWLGAKHGSLLFTIGLFKKTLADLLAANVSFTFDGAGVSTLDAWTGTLAFAAQIYGDFSGYTDMAIGAGMILGFQIPLNFRLPYFASSPVDFWKRWHISLSSWLRDYLYISLGGNRTNRYRNIMVTMLLGGLWHGAAWTFVIWGFFHGAIIVATHYLASLKLFLRFSASTSLVPRLLKWAITFYLVLIGWVFFRAQDFSSALTVLGSMHGVGTTEANTSSGIAFVLTVVALIIMHVFDWVILRFSNGIEKRIWLFWPLLFFFQFICFMFGAPSDAFIYFQF